MLPESGARACGSPGLRVWALLLMPVTLMNF